MMILENKYDKLFHKKIVFVAECFAVEKNQNLNIIITFSLVQNCLP